MYIIMRRKNNILSLIIEKNCQYYDDAHTSLVGSITNRFIIEMSTGTLKNLKWQWSLFISLQ